MNIKTKYNIGDEVWFIFNYKPTQGKILGLTIYSPTYYFYTVSILHTSGTMNEKDLFPTKEELLKSL